MTNTTTTYWEIDGVSLQTLAQNIETLGGGREQPPTFRGDDITIPYRPGQMWVPKTVDSRVIELAMWVRGANPDGTIPAGGSAQRDLYDDNWRNLRALFWRPGQQFSIKKRFRVNGVLRSATALVEYAGGLTPTMTGRKLGKFSVQLKVAGAYFFDDELKSVTLAAGDNALTILGDAPTTKIYFTIAGRSGLVIRNKTNNIQWGYGTSILTLESLAIDIDNFLSTLTPASGPAYNSEAYITHSGNAMWMILNRGANVVNLASTSGAGIVTLQYRSAWL